jgi:hypothetical protein
MVKVTNTYRSLYAFACAGVSVDARVCVFVRVCEGIVCGLAIVSGHDRKPVSLLPFHPLPLLSRFALPPLPPPLPLSHLSPPTLILSLFRRQAGPACLVLRVRQAVT